MGPQMEAFFKYFEITERKGWRLPDLDWEHADWEKASEPDRQAVLATSAIESGVPHYTRTWTLVDGFPQDWELSQFISLWAGEEERHNVALRRAALALGVADDSNYHAIAQVDFAQRQKEACPSGCYQTIAGMLTYAMVQEVVTWKFYSQAAKNTRSAFLAQLFGKIGEDEMRHHVWFRETLKARYATTLPQEREAFLDQIFEAVKHFAMPHKYYHLHEEFFANSPVSSGFARMELTLRVAKALSFAPGLVVRLRNNLGDA